MQSHPVMVRMRQLLAAKQWAVLSGAWQLHHHCWLLTANTWTDDVATALSLPRQLAAVPGPGMTAVTAQCYSGQPSQRDRGYSGPRYHHGDHELSRKHRVRNKVGLGTLKLSVQYLYQYSYLPRTNVNLGEINMLRYRSSCTCCVIVSDTRRNCVVVTYSAPWRHQRKHFRSDL